MDIHLISIVKTGHRGIAQMVKYPETDSHYNAWLYRQQAKIIFQGDPNKELDGLDGLLESMIGKGETYQLYFEVLDVVSGEKVVERTLGLVNRAGIRGVVRTLQNGPLSQKIIVDLNSWTQLIEENFDFTGGPIWDLLPDSWNNGSASDPDFYRMELKLTKIA